MGSVTVISIMNIMWVVQCCVVLMALFLLMDPVTSANDPNPKLYKAALKAKEKDRTAMLNIPSSGIVKPRRENYWLTNSCGKLVALIQAKKRVIEKLNHTIHDVELNQAKISEKDMIFQVHTFQIFQREINESENEIFMAINGLQRALQVLNF